MDLEQRVYDLSFEYDSSELQLLIDMLKTHVKKQSRHFVIVDEPIVREKLCHLIDSDCLQYVKSIGNNRLYIYTGRNNKYSLKKINHIINIPDKRAASIRNLSFDPAPDRFEYGKKMNTSVVEKRRRDNVSTSVLRSLIMETINEYSMMNSAVQETTTG